jgi:LysR family transcriptional regulator, nod-box dependent transcriptional activator
MRFNKLDLNLLVALDALLSEQSITRAAEAVHIGQPAMSNALARLRDFFDDELLVQVGRRMELTPRAQSLRNPVRDVLIRVEAAVVSQPSFDPQSSEREFRLSVSDYTNAILIPHLLAVVHRLSSKVRFVLLPQVLDPKLALERGEVDLMIIPERFAAQDHPMEHLFNESFNCLVWSESPLAHGKLTLDRYMSHAHIVMEPPHGKAYETAALSALGIHRKIGVSTFSFATAPRLVVNTSLIVTLHDRLARQAVLSLPVVRRPMPVKIEPMVQVMQWHEYRSKDPGLIWLRDILKIAVREMDPK